MTAAKPRIEVRNLFRSFPVGDEKLTVLHGLSFSIAAGEFTAIMGPSGSGKSTLMHILGCFDRASSGEYWLDGIEIGTLKESALAGIRNKRIGFVFQAFNLIPRLSVETNVELPMVYAGVPRAKRRERARALLTRVGLENRMSFDPARISGGQRQRAAIARALVNDPAILLADEPTGNLDTETSDEILTLFKELSREGRTIVIVTHDHEVAARCGRTIEVRDGRIVSAPDPPPGPPVPSPAKSKPSSRGRA